MTDYILACLARNLLPIWIGRSSPPSRGKKWAEWERDVDIITYLVSHLDKSVVAALRAYRIKRMSFAEAARACGKTISSLRGFAGIATRLAQKFCREVSPHMRRIWDHPYLHQYDD